MTEDKKLYVEKIRKGTVIDHVQKGLALSVLKILGLAEVGEKHLITIGINVGKPDHKKDIIKVENVDLEEKQLNQIALISPQSRISFIEDYKVREKIVVKVPSIIKNIVKCPNEKCITNVEREPVQTEFSIITEDPLKISCIYCERVVRKAEIMENLR